MQALAVVDLTYPQKLWIKRKIMTKSEIILRLENKILKKALEDILNHQKLIAGTMVTKSATYHIAKKALEESFY